MKHFNIWNTTLCDSDEETNEFVEGTHLSRPIKEWPDCFNCNQIARKAMREDLKHFKKVIIYKKEEVKELEEQIAYLETIFKP